MPATTAELGELVSQVARLLRHRNRSLGIAPHHFRALRIISREPIRPARLAEQLAITPRAVTDVVDALLDATLISAQPDPSDRRAKIVSITPAGEEKLRAARRQRDAMATELFGSLGDTERSQLADLLGEVLDRARQDSS